MDSQESIICLNKNWIFCCVLIKVREQLRPLLFADLKSSKHYFWFIVNMVPNIQVESNVLTVDEVERVQRQKIASKKQGNESKRLLGKTIQSLQVELDEMKSKYEKLDDLYRYTRDRD